MLAPELQADYLKNIDIFPLPYLPDIDDVCAYYNKETGLHGKNKELLDIFRMQCKKGCYVLAQGTEELVRDFIAEESADDSFGNARGVRNLFEHILVAQNNRLAKMENVTRDDLMQILPDDVLSARGKIDE